MLDVVGFASGSPLSVLAMQRLARDHRLRAIVLPPAPRAGWRGVARRLLRGAPRDPFEGIEAPRWTLAQAMQARPDAVVVASFPALLPVAAFAGARLGAFNLHMSLLPRHRGVDPIFSTYWDDDRQAGVSVHWLAAGVDRGPVAAQAARPLPRGLASRELYAALSRDGVDTMSAVLAALAQGRAGRVPQDAARATQRNARAIAALRVPAAQWPCERAWHVLAGLGDQYHGLLDGPFRHGRALGYRAGVPSMPGHIETTPVGYVVHCLDGVVDVGAAPR